MQEVVREVCAPERREISYINKSRTVAPARRHRGEALAEFFGAEPEHVVGVARDRREEEEFPRARRRSGFTRYVTEEEVEGTGL